MRARDSNSAPGTLRKVTSRRRRHNTAKGWVRDRLMRPVLSTTGAVRLEDVKGETLMVQIATKSMLLNVKTGHRIVDDCVTQKQRDLMEAAAKAKAAEAAEAAAAAASAAAQAASAAAVAASAASAAASAASEAAR